MANSWFRFYSEWLDDAKIQMLSPEMQRHHVALLCLRCQQPTENMTDAQIAFRLRVDETLLKQIKGAFLQAGFIDDNWTLVNWNKRQFLSDCSTARVQRFRERQALKRGETLQKRPETVPVTPPEQKQNRTEQKKPSARGTRLAPDFKPSDTHGKLAAELGLSVEEELDRFRDYWAAKAGREAVKADWNAAFRTWLRKARDFHGAHLVDPGTVAKAEPADPIKTAAQRADFLRSARERKANGHYKAIGNVHRELLRQAGEWTSEDEGKWRITSRVTLPAGGANAPAPAVQPQL